VAEDGSGEWPAPGEDALRAVERTNAQVPLDVTTDFDRGPELLPDALADEPEPEDVSGILDPIELALLHHADDLPPEAVNDRTAAHESPLDIFAAIPDPEDSVEPQRLVPEESSPLPVTPRVVRVPGPEDPAGRRKFHQAPTAAVAGRQAVPIPAVEGPQPWRPVPRTPAAQPARAVPQPVGALLNDHTGLEPIPDIPQMPRRKRRKPAKAQRIGARPKPVAKAQPAQPLEPSEPSVVFDLPAADGLSGAHTSVFQAEAPTGVELPRGRLVVEDGEQRGKTWYLNRNRLHLGRGTDNDIVLMDISVSRRHLRVDRHADGFVLVDAGSGNGTFLNGKRVSEEELYDGDAIELGGTVLRYSTVGRARIRPARSDAPTTDPRVVLARHPAPEGPRRIPTRWLVLPALAAFLTVLITLVVVRSAQKRDVESRRTQEMERAQIWLDKAEAAAASRQWGQALGDLALARGLARDPTAFAEIEARLTAEQTNHAAVEKARALPETATADDVRAALTNVSGTSVYAADAKAIIQAAERGDLARRVAEARTALARGQDEVARRLAEQVLAVDSRNEGARAVLETIKEEAAVGADPSGSPRPDSKASDQLEAGTRHYRRGRYADAVVAFNAAASLATDEATKRRARARSSAAEGFRRSYAKGQKAAAARRTVQAIQGYEAALRFDRRLGGYQRARVQTAMAEPQYFEAVRALQARRYADAARYTRKVLGADPGHGNARRLAQKLQSQAQDMLARGRQLMDRDPAEARRLLREAADTADPGSPTRRDALRLMK
jgi:hypothetical protein